MGIERVRGAASAMNGPWARLLLGVLMSSALIAVFAAQRAAWPIGFVAWVPWMLALHGLRSNGAAIAAGVVMSIAFVLAAFSWFGLAVAEYTGLPVGWTLLLFCLLAPLLQPQVWLYSWARHATQRYGLLWAVVVASMTWLTAEWLLPKVLGDTFGHGLAPAITLRQIADLGGVGAITLCLLLSNEAMAAVLRARRAGWRSWLPALLAFALIPSAMGCYGVWRLSELQQAWSEPVEELRVGLVQSALVDYEQRRRDSSAHAVVREVLDVHFELSQSAIEQHGVDALVWAETVYPTTFLNPRSEDGAAFDREILEFVRQIDRPLVFGTYDIDHAGEYNAAAFVEPGGLLGFYRKTRPFPITEHVPSWLDGPRLRAWLPWAGSWQPGDGARVFPLRSRDGRTLQVVPLICLDDVGSRLAIEGARLGAQAIVGLSNDAWFSATPQGAELHLMVAQFRSIETRLPQLRVTNNGLSAFIDPAGEVLAVAAAGDRAVLAGPVPAQAPPPTLMVRWGEWLGPAALAGLAVFLVVAAVGRLSASRDNAAARVTLPKPGEAHKLWLLPSSVRWAIVVLRGAAATGLGLLLVLMLRGDGLQVSSAWQIQLYLAAVVLPLCLAGLLKFIVVGTARVEGRCLIIEQRGRRIELDLDQLQALQRWCLPLPAPGLSLQFRSGRRWAFALMPADPPQLLACLVAQGVRDATASAWSATLSDWRSKARRRWLDSAWLKFALFPLLPALPAFRLHQHITYGGAFGEYYTYGLQAWLLGLLIWWASWSLGLMLFAAALRTAIETLCWVLFAIHRTQVATARFALEWLGRGMFYLGVPIWFAWRVLS
ncbi:apolipoprotein N-acyltransferase [Pseudomarimonas arenosa]|uniref:Apolipoprotein N-acyltransferase n=1 Tax=Pseudomarimonas arenosa TaxID=2774145 RepID=A0AAW3ZUV3_9GAMM|nr:apolipoprotein N-acyltransferase [Pseudomarimonas arenosa]MBD8527816.1 apolipoprotein N-acyltransferase [Pseudomarimonas arenosa]